MKLKMTRSTGNVYRDIGFSSEEAEHLRVRSTMMVHLQRAISVRNLTQAAAAKKLHVTQPRISDLMRGRIDLFSTDALIEMLSHLGIRVKIVLTQHRRRTGAA